MSQIDRQRHIDINKLSLEEVDSLSEQIGAKTREICDAAVAKINKFLHIYGLKAKIAISIEPLENNEK